MNEPKNWMGKGESKGMLNGKEYVVALKNKFSS